MRIRYKRFSVTHAAMGSVDVFVNDHNMRYYDECKTDQDRHHFVAHLAWCELWNGPAAKMLKQLCDTMGVDPVKTKFTNAITIEETESYDHGNDE